MGFSPENWNVDLTKHRKKFFLGSIVAVLLGILCLFTLGLNLGVDFESGSNVEVQVNTSLTEEALREDFKQMALAHEPRNMTIGGDQNQVANVRFIEPLSKEDISKVQSYMKEKYGEVPNISTVSPLVGKELARNALISVLIASVAIVLYVAVRFQFLYGIAAIVGLLHDAFFVIVLFSLFQVEVNVPFIAAILTVVGYSINDTIVTFDRIRENVKREKKEKPIEDFNHLARIVNKSLLQVITRSINTMLTVLFAALALFIFGSEAIRSFSLALVIGLIVGTYSSMFLCAQMWLVWEWRRLKRLKEKPPQEEEMI
ncbi:protein translocase subunit SecF [Bacillus sp. FSL W7-1360]